MWKTCLTTVARTWWLFFSLSLPHFYATYSIQLFYIKKFEESLFGQLQVTMAQPFQATHHSD
jgi:hypothetical protein